MEQFYGTSHLKFKKIYIVPWDAYVRNPKYLIRLGICHCIVNMERAFSKVGKKNWNLLATVGQRMIHVFTIFGIVPFHSAYET